MPRKHTRNRLAEMRGNEVWYRGRKVGYVDSSGGMLILIETLGPLILKLIMALIEQRKGQRPQRIEAHVGGQVTAIPDPAKR